MAKSYDYSMLFLSLYVLVVLALSVILDWPETTQEDLDRIDFAVCIVFLGDWFYFLLKSADRKRYFRMRLVDLVASIPFVTFLRAFRIVRAIRIIRALRLLRGVRGIAYLLRLTTMNRRLSAVIVYVICTAFVCLYCSVGIYNFERGLNPSIHHYGDALWLCFTTLTTVGYGDVFPVTGGGRIMSAVLVLTGLGLFSMVTAEFAAVFLNYIREERTGKP